MTRSRHLRAPRRPWTAAEDAAIRERWEKDDAATIARDLGRTRASLYNRVQKLGLRKSMAWVAERARQRWSEGRHQNSRAHLFGPGHVPANKGLRRPGYAPGRMAQTQFRKGQMAGAAQRKWVPIGTEIINTKRDVLMRKMTDDPALYPAARWRPVHVLVWETVHGPVPAGHFVVFRPGMKTYQASEITVDRLELVTRAENMRRNTIHHYPPILADTMRLVGRVQRQQRKHDGQEQH